MTYNIERSNGENETATSLKASIDTARRMLGALRVYRGARYQTDRLGIDGCRQNCTGLDIWTSRADVNREMGTNAPVVISWRNK